MRKNRFLCAALCFAILFGISPFLALATEVQDPTDQTQPTSAGIEGMQPSYDSLDVSVSSGCHSLDAQIPLFGQDKALKTAQAGILYEVNSQSLLYGWNPDLKLPPASLVKIMTCMIVLESCDIREEVIVTDSAMGAIPKTSATLKLLPGEKFTVDHLLYGLMVGAANDAAVVLAEHVAGSQGAFVALMNRRAAELGCKDTTFVNPHGLHDDLQMTTARDVARIVSAAMQSEQFMEYFGTTHFTLPATELSEERSLETTNYLLTIGTPLYYDSRVTGGRTGITSDSLRSIAVTAKAGDLDLVAVVLSAEPSYNEDGIIKYFGNYEEAKQLVSTGFDSTSVRQVLYAGQNLGQFHVVNGSNAVAVGPVQSASVVLPSNVKVEDLVVRYGNMTGALNAPIKAGEQVTAAEVWYGSVCVAYSPVVSLNSSKVNHGSALQENRYGGNSKVWVVALIALMVIALCFGGYYLARRFLHGMQNVKSNIRYRRRRYDRRRTK